MKNIILAAIVYAVAFIAVTGILILLNYQYKNIFAFDFSPREVKKVVTNKVTFASKDYSKIEKFVRDEFKKELLDTLKKLYFEKKTDTVQQIVVKDPALLASLDKAIDSIQKKDIEIAKVKKQNEELKKQINQKQESKEDYQTWLKKNSKLLDSMTPQEAAKIISNYSDNVAKDLIFGMKSKRAAEILRYMKPEAVQKITGR